MPMALATAFVGQTKSCSVVAVAISLTGEDNAGQLQTSCMVNAYVLPGVRPWTRHAVVFRTFITGQLMYGSAAAPLT